MPKYERQTDFTPESLFDLCEDNMRHVIPAVTDRDEWSAEKAYLAVQCGLRGYIGSSTGTIDYLLCDYILAASKAGRNLRLEHDERVARKARKAADKAMKAELDAIEGGL